MNADPTPCIKKQDTSRACCSILLLCGVLQYFGVTFDEAMRFICKFFEHQWNFEKRRISF